MYTTAPLFLSTLAIADGQTLRCDCPYCFGKNTFSVSKRNGLILWHCFRASCAKTGKHVANRSLQELRNLRAVKNVERNFEPPSWWVNVLSNDRAVSYLSQNNCLEAYTRRLTDIKYDPKQDRVCFVVKNADGKVVDAVGRAMQKGSHPKWLRYGRSSEPYIVGSNSSVVIVEDCASACAVAASDYTGFALLGTSLSNTSLLRLTEKNVLIALDKDATRKALEMQKLLSFFTTASVVPLERDLKYENAQGIVSILSKYAGINKCV